ncbi:MAG: type VI secretion system protein TssR domain-containing protein [Bacteroidota bacterium]
MKLVSTIQHITTTALLFILGTALFAQTLPKGAKAKDWPSKYTNPVMGVDLAPAKKGEVFEGAAWQVYSDRVNNVTTSQPNGGSKVATLGFLELLYVYQEQGEYLRLVKDPKFGMGMEELAFSTEAKDFGWIHKEKLLLWIRCLVTPDKSSINKKAMILNTLETLDTKKNKFDELAAKEVKFHLSPSLDQPGSRSAGLFNVFYIYKYGELNGKKAVLLGREARARQGDRITNSISGWVPTSRIVQWDHRVALEPNWTETAVKERSSKSQLVKFFSNREAALTYQMGGTPKGKETLWNDDPKENRNKGEWRRFPVLGNNNGVVRVGLMGDINSQHGKITPELLAEIQDRHGEAKKGLRNIDVVFVVDATTSMGPYFKPISEAIRNTIRELGAQNIHPNKIRFGAVAYRDYAETTRKVESARLTSDGTKVAEFLSTIDAKDYKDSDKPEAVFYGLKTAVKSLGMSKEHTNIVVLIGDAGNHSREDPTQVPPNEIISLLRDYKANFMVFQARNPGGHATFEDFVSQNKHLMKTVAMKIYQSQVKIKDVKISFPVLETVGPQIMKINNGATAASLIYTLPGSTRDPKIIQKEVEDLVKVSLDHTDKFLQGVEDIVVSGDAVSDVIGDTPESNSPYVSSFTPAIMLYLSETLKLDQDQLQQIAGKNYQLFMEAYAPVQVKGHGNSLFQYVLFLTRNELGDLARDLGRLVDATNNFEARRAMVEAWISLLEAHVGNLDRAEMEEMSMEEVSNKVFGIPATSGLLSSQSLKNLEDKKAVPDHEFHKYVNQIREKLQEIEKIFHANNYKYSFMSNDRTYYWIEQTLLP